jgi:hypothetical protein
MSKCGDCNFWQRIHGFIAHGNCLLEFVTRRAEDSACLFFSKKIYADMGRPAMKSIHPSMGWMIDDSPVAKRSQAAGAKIRRKKNSPPGRD